jgi:hypothetical protein
MEREYLVPCYLPGDNRANEVIPKWLAGGIITWKELDKRLIRNFEWSAFIVYHEENEIPKAAKVICVRENGLASLYQASPN